MLTDVLNGIGKITTLEDIQEVVRVARQKAKYFADRAFRVDDKVQLLREYHGRKPYDTIGVITKVNPKKLKVKFEGFGIWTITKTMVKIVD